MKIQEELDGVDANDVKALKSLKHLTGTINESMRLLPAALTTSPGSRISPSGGIEVDGIFIPGGVTICTSRYVLGRRKNHINFLLTVSIIANLSQLTQYMKTQSHSFQRDGTVDLKWLRIDELSHLLELVSPLTS